METITEPMKPCDPAIASRERSYEIANRLADLYVSFRGRYTMFRDGMIFIPKGKGEPSKLTNRVVYGHVMREYAIGVFGGAKASKFVCFDVDDGNRETVRKLIAAIEAFGVSRELVYVSSSGGKGFHVEVFFEPFAYADQLRTFYRWVIQYGGFDSRLVEFRPAHNQSIKLPLSIHPRTGKVCWYLDPETLEPIETAEYVLSIEKMSAETFHQLVHNKQDDLQSVEESETKRPADKATGLYEVMDQRNASYRPLTDKGQRHNMMMGIAMHQREIGKNRDECERALESWLSGQNHDMIRSSAHEVMRDISEITAWVYSDKFRTNGGEGRKQGYATITRSDMELVIRQKSKSARKLLFLLSARQKAGLTKLSQRRMAEVIGVVPATVFALLQTLENDGIIKRKKGRRKISDGRFIAEGDTCFIAMPKKKAGDACIMIGMRELIEHFEGVYYRTIHELLGGSELGYMTAGERKEYEQYLRDDKNGGAGK